MWLLSCPVPVYPSSQPGNSCRWSLLAIPIQIPFSNSYSTLPPRFYARLLPTPVRKPRLIAFNHALAAELGIKLHECNDKDLAQLFSGNLLPQGADPLAMAYAGHQFGQLNPQLGDGRALLLGDLLDQNGQRRDIQLKGSGRTPFSRRGDGRSPLGPVLREYLLCEGMHALGVPTTRALAAVTTGENLYRQFIEPGAIFTRVAASHIRVGTFVYLAIRDDNEGIRLLADHVLERHYPEIDCADPARYQQLFAAICRKQAELVAWWMQLGFVHGVMNTDNMTVSGEGIDYGPCAFLEAYKAGAVFSSIDHHGRYAFANQPDIARWNLARLAETLLGLFTEGNQQAIDFSMETLEQFARQQHQAWLEHIRAKLGFSELQEGDETLISKLLQLLEAGQADYSLFLRNLANTAPASAERQTLLQLIAATADPAVSSQLHAWLDSWQAALRQRGDTHTAKARMQAHNPAIIPRNHRIEEVITAAEKKDFTPFEHLLAALAQPYAELPEFAEYRQPATARQQVWRTFCGT